MRTPTKEEVKKLTISKAAEYVFLVPFLGFLLLGLYQVYGKDIVADTARTVFEDEQKKQAEKEKEEKAHQKKQIKILHNYMMLQNKELYDKAKELEED